MLYNLDESSISAAIEQIHISIKKDNSVSFDNIQDGIKTKLIKYLKNKKKVDEYMGSAEGADIVLMDPPREGASMAFINNLIKMNPRQILYISCNPLTQVRDLKQLALQYKVTWIQGVDLFPQTKHIESFAILEKKVRRP